MLHFNRRSYTLEPVEHFFELQDKKEPELYKDVFPYSDIPRIPFNWRHVPMRPAEEIWVTDTTFRDGQQSRPPFTVDQICRLFDMLHRISGPKGMIRATEFFLYTKKDREAVEKCLEKGYEYPEVTGWIRAHKNDFKLVKEMGLKETGILMSCSDYHIFLKLNKTRKEAAEMYLSIAKAALEEGITPRCHLEDITRADFYGFVVPFVCKLMDLSAEAGIPIKIRACDTLGYGVTYPGAAMPRSVPGIVYGLIAHAGVAPEHLEWHGHNDFYKGLINAATAWLYGCSAANGTLLGIGERTGNVPVEALLIEAAALRGTLNGADLTVMAEVKEFFEKEIGMPVPPNQPFVGDDFNKTRAGIHADGLLKNEEIYNIFDTAKLLNRPPSVAITDKSGVAGIAHWINMHLSLEGDAAVDKNHPAVQKIKEWIDKEYEKGRTTAISDEEMAELVRLYLTHERED